MIRMDCKLREGIELFNQQKFFECHEVIERIWLEAKGSERNFLKSLIQAAAAFHHVQNKNISGAKGLFRTSLGYLRVYESENFGIDIRKLISNLEQHLEELDKNSDVTSGKFPVIDFKD